MLASSIARFVSRAAVSTRAYATGSKAVIEVTDATFQQDVIEASHKTPIVLDLWAAWCRPCRVLAPVLEEAVAEHNGAVVLAKMNVDTNRAVAVEAIPTVYGYSKGQPVTGFVGGQPSSKIKEFLAELVAKHNKA